jgi:hypothetical protein
VEVPAEAQVLFDQPVEVPAEAQVL